MLKNKIFIVLITCVIVGIVLLFAVKTPSIDLLISVVPGWHTTIYPPKLIIFFSFALILFLCLITYLFLRLRKKL
jgi:hypothetical protein